MKPLPIEEQIKVLRKLHRTLDIYGMCIAFDKILKKDGMPQYKEISDYIPSFTYDNYLHFYSSVKAVQKSKDYPFWDNIFISGRLRRRRFVRHLIKELKKQL